MPRGAEGMLVMLATGLALLASLAGCAPAAPTAPAAPAATPAAAVPAAAANAPAVTAAPTATSEPTQARVVVQVTGLGNEAGLYTALERGYFRDEHLDIELVPFDSGAKAIPGLGTGELDVGLGSIGPALYNAVERGVSIRIIAPLTRQDPDSLNLSFMVRKVLWDSGEIRTPADLRGRRIAVPALASGNEYVVERLLQQGGLQVSDVSMVELGIPDMGPAFANGSLDAALVGDPGGTVFGEQGWATKWLGAAAIVPGIQFTFILFSERFATERAEVAIRWLSAYLRGARDWQRMLDTGEARDELFGYYSKYTTLKDRALFDRTSLAVMALDGRVDVPGLRDQAAWARDRGYINQLPPLDRLIDARLFAAARQRVGLP